MFVLFHLITGLILGFLISDLLDDRRWLLPCAAGAILPDIIDKPIGYIFFPTTIGYGRIYSHTILVAMIILAIGLAIWSLKHDPGVISLGVGILSHQVLDVMWLQPQNWYFPLLGPFNNPKTQNYFFILLLRELSNPVEWIIALLLITGLLAFIYRDEIASFVNQNRQAAARTLAAGALLLCILSGILIGWGITRHDIPEIGWNSSEELLVSGMVIALAAYLVWHWRSEIADG